MSWVWIDPRHADDLSKLSLAFAGDFLRLQGIILGGHPSRHVRRVELIGAGGPFFVGYLKKEHRVRLRDRLASAWAGFGWSSKSVREAKILEAARRYGFGCPEVIAYGEEGGEAFLLLNNIDMADLRKYLKAFPRQRRRVARALGRELARLHAAGFQHPELYAKHILIRQEKEGYRFAFLDWQLARRRRHVSERRRCRDLAALHATLSDEFASRADRFAFVRAYRQAAGIKLPSVVRLARRADALGQALCGKRRIRELRQTPLPQLAQNLIWVDGEGLCVTLDFWKETAGQAPKWLDVPRLPTQFPAVEETSVPFGARLLHLTRRWFNPPLSLPLPGLKKAAFPSPEFEQVGTLMRLQRFGLRGPRLLAVGHRDLPRRGKYSFLLVEPIEDARPLEELPFEPDAALLGQLGSFLRRTHDAGYAFKQSPFAGSPHWGVCDEDDDGELVYLRLDGLQRCELSLPQRLARDLHLVLDGVLFSRSEMLARLVQAYLGRQQWSKEAEKFYALLQGFLKPRERQVA